MRNLFGRKKEVLPIDMIHRELKDRQKKAKQAAEEREQEIIAERQEAREALAVPFAALSEIRQELKKRGYKVSPIEFIYTFTNSFRYSLTVKKRGYPDLQLQAGKEKDRLGCVSWVSYQGERRLNYQGWIDITDRNVVDVKQIIYPLIREWLAGDRWSPPDYSDGSTTDPV
jgi:hypothetical protein